MTKKKNKNKSKFKRGVIGFFLSLVLVCLSLLLAYYFVLPSVLLNTKEPKNILIVSNNLDDQNSVILLAHLDKNPDKNLIFSIDGKEVVNINSDYGEYSLNAIYQLLKIDGKSAQEIKSIFSNILNISIDDVVVSDNFYKNSNLLKLHFLAESIETFQLNKISDLEGVCYKLSTLDEKTYKNCSVSVVNTTSENGLAQKVSEIIENTGARVMQVEGSDSLIEKTTIYYPFDQDECRQLVDRILGIFPTEVEIMDQKEIVLTKQFRANVIVVIGEDY